tara:strand:+ start:1085 stop:2176 length:1092 start_codon:yes stop_codon:yes gene_type:complete
MKKIIFFMPNIERGGIEKNLVLLSDYFIKKNYSVEIIFSKLSKDIQKNLHKKIKFLKSKNYITITFFPKRIVNSINCFLYLLLFKPSSKSILISMQDHPFSIIACKKINLKCVLRIANHPKYSLKFFNNFFKYKIKLFIKLFFYRLADGIICNSKSSSEYLKSKINIQNITSIYNPIKLKKNIKQKSKNYLLTVGRLESQKNISGIIIAFKKIEKIFPSLKLIIIGSGQESEKLKNLSKNLNISNKVKFENFKAPEKYYKISKIFILNSFFEGLPNVLIEALNYKLPIISANCESGPKEILSNGKYGFLTKVNNPKHLSKKISFVLKNYKLSKNKAIIGYKSLKRFDIKSQCFQYENYLKKII